jgi:proteasome lid subunit RPN8/RPN11
MKKQNEELSPERRFKGDAYPIFPVPHIQLDPAAEAKIWDVVQKCKYEAGWLGTVREIAGGYLIEDIFCLDQVVNEVHNSVDAEGLKALYRRLLDEGQAGFDKLERLYFWGHSHVNMPEFPSSIDRDTMAQVWAPSNRPIVIMGIFNKTGNAWFSIYDFANGIVYDRVKLERPIMLDDALAQELDAELAGLEF